LNAPWGCELTRDIVNRFDPHPEADFDFLYGPFPVVLTSSIPSLQLMHEDNMELSISPGSDWQSMPSLSPLDHVSIDPLNPKPVWLALIWVVFFNTVVCSGGGQPGVQALLSQIEATSRDEFLDLWSWGPEDEEWLRWNITVSSPEGDYCPWVNSFPSLWRQQLTYLTIHDWELLKTVTVHRRSTMCSNDKLPYHFRFPTPLLLPKDGLLWIGSMVWLFLKNLEPGDRKVDNGSVAPLDAVWFSRMHRGSHLIDALNFPPIELSATTTMFRNAIISSKHTCYRQSESVMALYAALWHWLDYNSNIPITGIDTYRVASDQSCEVCKALPQWRLGSAQGGSESVCSLEIALKAFTPPIANPKSLIPWLEVNRQDIITAVVNFAGFNEHEKGECVALIAHIPIYQVCNIVIQNNASQTDVLQRFLVYTFAHVKLCEDDDRYELDLPGVSITRNTDSILGYCVY